MATKKFSISAEVSSRRFHSTSKTVYTAEALGIDAQAPTAAEALAQLGLDFGVRAAASAYSAPLGDGRWVVAEVTGARVSSEAAEDVACHTHLVSYVIRARPTGWTYAGYFETSNLSAHALNAYLKRETDAHIAALGV